MQKGSFVGWNTAVSPYICFRQDTCFLGLQSRKLLEVLGWLVTIRSFWCPECKTCLASELLHHTTDPDRSCSRRVFHAASPCAAPNGRYCRDLLSCNLEESDLWGLTTCVQTVYSRGGGIDFL